MADDIPLFDFLAQDDVAAQHGDGFHLGGGKGTVAEFVAGIDDLDADRALVDVGMAAPTADAGMPGAAVLADQRIDRAVFLDDVMRTDSAGRIGEPPARFLTALHAGVMQYQ